MYRRVHYIIFVIFYLSVFLYPYRVFSQEGDKFLDLPFSSKVKLLQGWQYTVLINGSDHHGAIDYDCEPDEKIFAAADGVAMNSRQVNAKGIGYGNFVFIKHPNGHATLYGHLKKAADHIKTYPIEQKTNINYSEWTPVKKGDYIGDCGMSGTDNVHLHFEVTTGKYSVGRIDSYDLYKTKQFYPPNKSFVAMGEKNLWANDPPQYTENGLVENTGFSGQSSVNNGIWETFKNLVVAKENSTIKGEQILNPPEVVDTGKLNLSFVDKKINITPKPAEQTKIIIHAKNTGTKIWKRNEISLNVTGGAVANHIFRHPSWITNLRPALLDNAEVKPGETGLFLFTINGLPPGSYTLKLIAVEVGTWTQIGTEQSIITISVAEPVEEKPVAIETPPTQVTPLEGIVRGIKDFTDSVIEKITEVIKSIPEFFGGGSGGGSSSAPSNENIILWVTVTAPHTGLITNTPILEISGERSANALIEIKNVSSTIEYPSNTTWRANVELVEGVQNIEVLAQGSEDIQSISVIYDSVSPEKPVISAVVDVANTIQLSWQTTDTGGSSEILYTIQKKIDGGEWSDVFTDTTNTSYVFSSELFHEYAFRAQAKDSAGNISDWSLEANTVTEWSKEIVFNEVAWSGSSGACPDREWIELYNPSANSVSVQNWQLDIDSNGLMQTIPLLGSIAGQGYYLISHQNTFGSTVTPDISLPQNIHLSDTGARLVLKNQTNESIDEVDQSSSWLGGITGSYPHTLERVSADLPSFASRTWKSSDSVQYGITSGSCGQITGSPRMNNNGYAYLSDQTLAFYSKDAEGNIVLSKEENPYLFSNITIPQGEKITLSPGVIFAGVSSDAQITVQGEFATEGTENDPVIITSKNDTEHVSSTALLATVFTGLEPSAGDWQSIAVAPTGKLTITHTLLKYGGNRYGASAFCQACASSRVIANQGGSISLSNTEISNGYESGSTGKPDALIYSDAGMVTLDQTELHHGKRALHFDGSTEVSGNSVTIHDFDLSDKVVYFQTTMPRTWESIIFTGNSPSYAYLPTFTVTSSYTMSATSRFEFTTVVVNPAAILTIEGGNIYANEIKVNGNLNISGGGSGSEIAGSASPSSTFSHIVFYPGSSGVFSHTHIRGGGYLSGISAYPFTSPRPNVLWIDGATVTISDSQFTDTRRPGGNIVLRNGNLTIQDSEIGWTTGYNKLDSWKDYGIVGNTQSTIRLENVNFRKMDYVVELNQSSIMTYDRMTRDNFIDLYPAWAPQKNWFPTNLFPF